MIYAALFCFGFFSILAVCKCVGVHLKLCRSPFAAPKDRTRSTLLCYKRESFGLSATVTVPRMSVFLYIYVCVCIYIHTYGCSCVCFLVCSPLAGSLPPIHSASRFATLKNRLQTVELGNRERATDVSLGFLHSN